MFTLTTLVCALAQGPVLDFALPPGADARFGVPLVRETAGAARLTDDGRVFVVSVGGDTIRVVLGSLADERWHVREYPAPHRLETHAAACSPNGQAIALFGNDSRVHVVDARTGLPRQGLLANLNRARQVVVSPNGTELLVVGRIRVRRGTFGHLNLHWVPAARIAAPRVAAWAPDGARFAVMDLEGKVEVWRTKAAHPESTVQLDMVREPPKTPKAPPGLSLFVTVPETPSSCALAMTAEHIAIARGTTLGVWSTKGRRFVLRTRAHRVTQMPVTRNGPCDRIYERGTIDALVFSPDGRSLASSGRDGKVEIRCLPDWRVVRTLVAGWPVRGLSFDGSGNRLLADCGRMRVVVWDLATGKQRYRSYGHDAPVTGLAVAGDTLLSFGKSMRAWDLGTGRRVEGAKRVTPAGNHRVASADGRLTATAGFGRIEIADVASGVIVHAIALDRAAGSPVMAFSGDTRVLAVAVRPGRVTLYEVVSARAIARWRVSSTVASLVFLPDGRLATGHSDGTIMLWDVRRRTAGAK